MNSIAIHNSIDPSYNTNPISIFQNQNENQNENQNQNQNQNENQNENQDQNERRYEIINVNGNEVVNRNGHGHGNENSTCKKCLIFVADICSPIYRSVLRVVFTSSVVFGWALAGIVALNQYKLDKINGVCSLEIWQFLLIVIIINLLCLKIYLFAWYYKTFKVYDVNYERFKNNYRLCIYGIIILQILLALSGSYLIFNQCVVQNLRNTMIYNVIFSWIISVIVFVILLIVFCGLFFSS